MSIRVGSTFQSWALMALFVMLLAACKEEPKAMSFPPAVVQVQPVNVGMIKDKSDFLGTMKSRKSVTLAPHVDGHIIEISCAPGQVVKAGDVLMKIDSRMQSAQASAVQAGAESIESDVATAKSTLASLQSTLQSKLANVDYTEKQHTRYEALQREGAVTRSDLDTWANNHTAAKADRDTILQQIEAQKMTIQKFERSHKQALASVQAQSEELRYYDIRAPFTGTMGDIPVKVGDHVTSATALATLTENHPLELYVAIPAERAPSLASGSKVSLANADGKLYGNSEVIFISPTVDPGSQTVLVKALYPNNKSELRADQTVRAEIVWRNYRGISVPTKAVTQSAGKFFVFVAEPGKDQKLSAKQVEIEVSGIEGSSYQVKTGLKETDRVITSGIQRLSDGAPIEAKHEAVNQNESTAQSTQQIH